MVLCKNGLTFKSEFSIEGLLGITLDNDDIFLVNIKECVSSTDRFGAMATATQPQPETVTLQKDLSSLTCDISSQSALPPCNLNEVSMLESSLAKIVASEAGKIFISGTKDVADIGKSPGTCGIGDIRSDRNVTCTDTFQLNCLDMTIGNYGKIPTDLDILLDSVSSTRKRDGLGEDTGTALLNQSDIEQLIGQNTRDGGKYDDSVDATDVILVKEESRLAAMATSPEKHTLCVDSMEPKQDMVSLATPSAAETFMMSIKGDEQLPGCSGWENAESIAMEMPLNLSEPQPEDLSTGQTKKVFKTVSHCGTL